MKKKGEWRVRSCGQQFHDNEAIVTGRRNVKKAGGDKCENKLHRKREKRKNNLRIERDALLY